MGWTGIPGNYRNESMKEAFEKVIVHGDYKDVCVDYAVRGNTAYMVIEYVKKETHERVRTIVVFLLRKSMYEFTYKDMDESMGPYYYDCPMRLLKKVEGFEPINENARKWREEVKRLHEEKKVSRKVTNTLQTISIWNRKASILEDREYNGTIYSLAKVSRLKAGYVVINKGSKSVVTKNRYYSSDSAWKSFETMIK